MSIQFPDLKAFLDRLNAGRGLGGGGSRITDELQSHKPDMQNPFQPPPAVANAMSVFQNPTMPPKSPGGLK